MKNSFWNTAIYMAVATAVGAMLCVAFVVNQPRSILVTVGAGIAIFSGLATVIFALRAHAGEIADTDWHISERRREAKPELRQPRSVVYSGGGK